MKKSFIVADITTADKRDFLREIVELAEEMDYRTEKPVVFTGKDDYLIFFSQHAAILSTYFDFSFESNIEILESVLNKKTLAEYARQANVTIPKTYSEEDELGTILETIEFPLIIKPAIKNRPDIDVVREAFRIRTCHSREALVEAIALLRRIDQSYVIQEYIPGNDNELYTVGTYSFRGELKAWSISKKIRQFPPGTGECAFGKTVHDEDLVENAAKLLKVSGFTGISQIEFKKYKGRYYLIEINPRVWSWHQIHTKVGVNFCKIAIDHINGTPYEKVVSPSRRTRYWMFLTMDLLHNYFLNRNESITRLIGDFLRCDVEAFLSLRDPAPFYYHLKRTIPYMQRELEKAREEN